VVKNRTHKPARTSKPSKPSKGGSTGGSSQPSNPSTPSTPSTPSKPTNPLAPITDPLTKGLGGVTQPVVDTLATLTEALDFCNSQFATIPDPLHLLDAAKSKCATKVQGMTEGDAAAVIPNTLTSILAWLGLSAK
jgi:hypothetical protein